jgi:translocation protein SEC72
MHSHGPQAQLTPQQQAQLQAQLQAQQQQQQQQMPVADADMVAAIDESFKPVAFKVVQNQTLVCPTHNQEKCADCGTDFSQVNHLSKLFVGTPDLAIPPPPSVMTNQLAQLVTKTKEEGNVRLIPSFSQ